MEKQTCLLCGEGAITPMVDQNSVEFHGIKGEVDNHYVLCDTCGADYAGPEQLRQNKRTMVAFKKNVMGLLSGAQVRQIREQLGLTQKDAADIFGGGPVAFSKYENDDVIQAESMDKLLRAVAAIPEVLAVLRKPQHMPKVPDAPWMSIPGAVLEEMPGRAPSKRIPKILNPDSGWEKAA